MPYSETWAEHYPDGTVIPYMDKKAREAIGEGYNPPYSAGQAIMYEGITYVANTAIASDEIWTPSHWTASNVCAMYNELKSNLYYLSIVGKMVKSFSLDSSHPYSTSFRNPFFNFILLGLAQGIGPVVIAVNCLNGTITARDLVNNSAFSSSYLTFSQSGANLTISSTSASVSYFTLIKGNMA